MLEWSQTWGGRKNSTDVDSMLTAECGDLALAINKLRNPDRNAGLGCFRREVWELVKLQGSITEPWHTAAW